MSCPEVVRPEGGEADVRPEGGEAVLPNLGGGGGSRVEGGEGVELPLSLAPRLCKKDEGPCSPSQHKA